MLGRTLSPFAERAYVLLRFVVGILFALHGAQKLFGFGGPKATGDNLMLAAGVIEFAGGILIAIGFFTRLAAFVASGEMAVAYFKQHWTGRFDESLSPLVNQGERAVLYCFVFLFIACHGAGGGSLDRRRKGPPA